MARRIAGVAVAVLFLAYFWPSVAAPPNSDDGGVTLGYIQRIARGERVHLDFIDYYGPLTYLLPAAAYRLAGERAVGVGVFLVVLKLLTLGAAYHAVRALASRFHGLLAVLATGVLLGLPWPMFQIPYAHHTTLPLILTTAAWVLAPGETLSRARIVATAALTAAMLLMKITTGAFVAAAWSFYLFYWLPCDASMNPAPPGPRRGRLLLRAVQLLGLVVYGYTFQRFVAPHFDRMYFLYLTGPLALGLAATLHRLVIAMRAEEPPQHQLRAAGLYVGGTLAFWVSGLLLCFGPHETVQYAHEQAAWLARASFVSSFAPVGVHGIFRGYGEYYWPQLPWLFTALYAVWLAGGAGKRRANVFAGQSAQAHARVTGVFVLVTLHTYVIYSAPDDAHIMQALLLVVPLTFVLLLHLERLFAQTPERVRVFRGAALAVSLAYLSTLVFLPEKEAYRWGPGDWGSAHLSHLPYHPEWSRFANPVDPAVSDRTLDRDLDNAARQVDSIADDGEEILVLGPLHLLYLASNTLPAPRRFSQLYYLLSHGMIGRPEFDVLMPRAVLGQLLSHPPRVVVDVYGNTRFRDALPELNRVLQGGAYRLVGRWGPLRVFVRPR